MSTNLFIVITFIIFSNICNIRTKSVTCSPNLSRKNNWSFCSKMAYGSNSKTVYKWKAKQKKEDIEREFSAELLVIKDSVWDEKIVPSMNILTC